MAIYRWVKLGKKQEYKPVYQQQTKSSYISDREIEKLWDSIKIPTVVKKLDKLYVGDGVTWLEVVEYAGNTEPSKWLE